MSDIRAYEAKFELPDGRDASLTYRCKFWAGTFLDPPEQDCSETQYFIEGVEVLSDEIEKFVAEEELQRYWEEAKDVTATTDFGGPDVEYSERDVT